MFANSNQLEGHQAKVYVLSFSVGQDKVVRRVTHTLKHKKNTPGHRHGTLEAHNPLCMLQYIDFTTLKTGASKIHTIFTHP